MATGGTRRRRESKVKRPSDAQLRASCPPRDAPIWAHWAHKRPRQPSLPSRRRRSALSKAQKTDRVLYNATAMG